MSDAICSNSLLPCTRVVDAHGSLGYCSRCYQRIRAGVPLDAPERVNRTMGFWERADTSGGPDSCWPWLYGTMGGKWPYGKFQGRTAHTVAWERANGRSAPAGLFVRHSCDNPPCVNPAHLLLGTPRDNTQDMISRGRRIGARKLTPDQVRAIRTQRHRTATEVGSDFGVSRSTITSIWSGRTWSHVV